MPDSQESRPTRKRSQSDSLPMSSMHMISAEGDELTEIGQDRPNPEQLAAMWRANGASHRSGPLYFWSKPPMIKRMSEPNISLTPSPPEREDSPISAHYDDMYDKMAPETNLDGVDEVFEVETYGVTLEGSLT